ncbi:Fibroblast growth factor receptor 2 isoform 2 [Schistosoma japonicum]|uniref:Fibroblast growth factor receptor 2 isoform 2 n=3 Tax=Schistosoma japonicum TaxID=6182 RepID=A0A4Z2DTN7_SCHJA|nr:Fibroblast growth factor receptor 2 isoform 2 [Schistosoma japonicum]
MLCPVACINKMYWYLSLHVLLISLFIPYTINKYASPDNFRFNSDAIVCEGDYHVFDCELINCPIDGILAIYKLGNEFVPANLSAEEKLEAEFFGKEPYRGLISQTLRRILNKYGVHKWNQTYDQDHKTFKYRYGPLTKNDSGLYYCRFIPNEYPGLMSTYMKLEVDMNCTKPLLMNWTVQCLPYFLSFTFILIVVLFWLWRRASKTVTYKLITIARSVEYYSLNSTGTEIANSGSGNNSSENATHTMLDPVGEPIINIGSVLIQRPPKLINKIKQRYVNHFAYSECQPQHQKPNNKWTNKNDIQRLKELDKRFLSDYRLEKDERYEFSRRNLQIVCRLGSGAFGIVYRGTAKNLTIGVKKYEIIEVAVKTLKDDFTEEDVSEFLKEMDIMKQLHHKHVIELYGVCTENGSPLLIMEYAPYGNLKEYLRHLEIQSNCNKLRLKLLEYGYQVANGMKYLETKCLIHRDLAARNILVGKQYQLKIADFGLTRFVESYYRKVKRGRVPVKWLAPESLTDRLYTTKSDVWSFGILLWEIFTLGSTPYPNIDATEVMPLILSGVRNEKPLLASDTIFEIMCKCWRINPTERLSFSEVVNLLEYQINDHNYGLDSGISEISMYCDEERSNKLNFHEDDVEIIDFYNDRKYLNLDKDSRSKENNYSDDDDVNHHIISTTYKLHNSASPTGYCEMISYSSI